VTQTIQDLNNSVTLIAGKTTWVRAYIGKHDGSVAVTANLQATGSDGTVSTISPAASVIVTAGESLETLRADWSKSLNFLLPASVTAFGGVTLKLVSFKHADFGGAIICEFCTTQTRVTFFAEPPLRVRAIGLRYTFGSPPQKAAPREIDYALLESWLGRAYPVSEVDFSHTETPVKFLKFGNAQDDLEDCGNANSLLDGIKTNDITYNPRAAAVLARTHYYGLVSDKGDFMRGCSSSGSASGPTGPDRADDNNDANYYATYGGHELGHTFGRDHPGASATMGFCGETPRDGFLDTDFPYPNGQIGEDPDQDSYGHIGLDVGDPVNEIPFRVLWPKTTFDVMTYCPQPQWLSAYTYEGIRRALLAENPGFRTLLRFHVGQIAPEQQQANLLTGPMVHVTAIVDLTRSTGKIGYVIPVELAEPQVGDTSRAALVVRNGAGFQLSRTPVVLRGFSDASAGADQSALVSAAVPFDPNMREIDLVLDQNILAQYRGTTTVPAAPRGLRFISSDIDQVLIWIPAVGSAGTVTYTVQTSDDGASWNTIAIDLREPILTLTPDQASALKARVIATNGFRSAAPVVVDLVPAIYPTPPARPLPVKPQ
jgi:hypothetical protein